MASYQTLAGPNLHALVTESLEYCLFLLAAVVGIDVLTVAGTDRNWFCNNHRVRILEAEEIAISYLIITYHFSRHLVVYI